jgi:hypothetical protein
MDGGGSKSKFKVSKYEDYRKRWNMEECKIFINILDLGGRSYLHFVQQSLPSLPEF